MGHGRKGKCKDYSGQVDGEKKKKQFEKSKVKCYNFQKLGHFSNECEFPKRNKFKGKEKMYMSQEDKDEEDESSFRMVLADEHADVLLQCMSDSHIDDM